MCPLSPRASGCGAARTAGSDAVRRGSHPSGRDDTYERYGYRGGRGGSARRRLPGLRPLAGQDLGRRCACAHARQAYGGREELLARVVLHGVLAPVQLHLRRRSCDGHHRRHDVRLAAGASVGARGRHLLRRRARLRRSSSRSTSAARAASCSCSSVGSSPSSSSLPSSTWSPARS